MLTARQPGCSEVPAVSLMDLFGADPALNRDYAGPRQRSASCRKADLGIKGFEVGGIDILGTGGLKQEDELIREVKPTQLPNKRNTARRCCTGV